MSYSTVTIFGSLNSLKSVFQSQSQTIFNGLLIVLTIGGEEVFKRAAFSCPCEAGTHLLYGLCFLVAPALSLFFVGVLINSITWRLVHGCFFRLPATRHGCRRSSIYWVQVLAQASVAPLAWLFVGFLDGSYYKCMLTSNPCPNGTDAQNLEIELHDRRLRSQSQIIAWLLLLVSVSFITLLLFINRCCDRYTYSQNYYMNLYREIEMLKFEEEAKCRAKRLAEANVNAFFSKKGRTKLDWDKISVVPINEFPHFLNLLRLSEMEEPYFSPLHHWAKCYRRDNPSCATEAIENLADYGQLQLIDEPDVIDTLMQKKRTV